MRAGQIRHRVRIEEPTTAQDDFGQPIPTWSEVITLWAKVEPLNGQERFDAQQIHGQVTHRITMRRHLSVTLTPEMRLIHRSRTFDINAILDIDERRKEWQLLCTEKSG